MPVEVFTEGTPTYFEASPRTLGALARLPDEDPKAYLERLSESEPYEALSILAARASGAGVSIRCDCVKIPACWHEVVANALRVMEQLTADTTVCVGALSGPLSPPLERAALDALFAGLLGRERGPAREWIGILRRVTFGYLRKHFGSAQPGRRPTLSDVDDVLQMVALVFHRNAKRVGEAVVSDPEMRAFFSLCRTAYFCAIQHARSVARAGFGFGESEEEDVPAADTTPTGAAARSEDIESVHAAINRVQAKYPTREPRLDAYVLNKLEGVSLDAIARERGVAKATVQGWVAQMHELVIAALLEDPLR